MKQPVDNKDRAVVPVAEAEVVVIVAVVEGVVVVIVNGEVCGRFRSGVKIVAGEVLQAAVAVVAVLFSDP